jgi:hypothetical protein
MRLIMLLLLTSVVFGQYTEPPLDDVAGNNTAAAAGLEGYYNASTAKNSTLHISFGPRARDLELSASLDIAGLSVLVDNMTSPVEGLSLLVARGYIQDHIIAIPSDGYLDFICDREWFYSGAQYAPRCDLDDDSCAEFENRTFVFYDVNVTFSFRNVSETVPLDSTLIPVPSSVMDEMRDSSGSEYLNVSVEGDVVFIYEINDRGFSLGDCSSHYYNVSQAIPFSLNRSFPVAGEHKLFFLSEPVLREQWFRNNRFNMVVLSQSPLYKAEVYLNGNKTKDIVLRNFSIVSDHYGLLRIESNSTNASGFFEGKTNGTAPVPLEEENHNYSHVYQFNHSYSGLGFNNLSLEVTDSFLGSSRYDERILSRMLSYNGSRTETGLPVSETYARGSSPFTKDEISSFDLSLGLIGLVFILIFLNFWLKK